MNFDSTSLETEFGVFALASVITLLPYTSNIRRGVNLTPGSIADAINLQHSEEFPEFYVDPSLFAHSIAPLNSIKAS